MTNSVDPDQTLGPAYLLLYLKLSVMFGNFVQQTTSADVIIRCIFCALTHYMLGKFAFFLCLLLFFSKIIFSFKDTSRLALDQDDFVCKLFSKQAL